MTPLLLLCARAQPDAGAVSRLASNGTDWDSLLGEADRHSLAPLLAWTLKHACPGAVPPAVVHHLERRLRANADRNLALAGELLGILKLFHGAAIPVVPFKGPAVAWSIYESPALREMRDLDLLVRPADAARAAGLLVEYGYRPACGTDRRFFRSGRELPLTSPAGVAIDLHWALAPSYFCHALDMDGIWTRLAAVRVAGRAVPSLGNEDLLIFLCIHGAKHEWCSLHWLSDLARLIDRCAIDWDALMARVCARRTSRTVFAGLLLAVDVLGAGVPAAIVARLRSQSAAAALAEGVRQRLLADLAPRETMRERTQFQCGLLERPTDILRFCWSLVAPTAADRECLTLPSPLFPLYYAFRPLRLIAKYSALAGSRIRAFASCRLNRAA
jgi:hypothetical protein